MGTQETLFLLAHLDCLQDNKSLTERAFIKQHQLRIWPVKSTRLCTLTGLHVGLMELVICAQGSFQDYPFCVEHQDFNPLFQRDILGRRQLACISSIEILNIV